MTGGGASHEFRGLRGGAVVNGDAIAVPFHVEDQVLAHDGQADEADVAEWHEFNRSLDDDRLD